MDQDNNNNLDLWRRIQTPPDDALKPISGGRLNGKTDINPVWRMEKITEEFGVCGFGWKYVVTRQWLEPGADGAVTAFVNLDLYIKMNGEWSEAIPGSGGSMHVEKERAGLYTSDECYKMATTDALSVAYKALGLASTIYRGEEAGKYIRQQELKAQRQDQNQDQGGGNETTPQPPQRQPSVHRGEQQGEQRQGQPHPNNPDWQPTMADCKRYLEASADIPDLKQRFIYYKGRGSESIFWQKITPADKKKIEQLCGRLRKKLEASATMDGQQKAAG